MRGRNPILNEKAFHAEGALAPGETMTVEGVVNKTLLLCFLVLGGAVASWSTADTLGPILGIAGGIVGFILAIVTAFARRAAFVTAPLYALAEGAFLGWLSHTIEVGVPGTVMSAVLGTFGTFFALLAIYRTGLIPVTENFRLGVFAATAGLGLLYLSTFVLGLFGITVPYVHESGLIGIGISLFAVGIASLNLVLDFDYIENGAAQGAPKENEWYASFGLLVTLVWLYVEMLKLVAKLNRR
jgi:uncharacterized YccA/Bax inhibitor family protein